MCIQYTGIDPRSKVWLLLDGIKTDKFDAVKTRIMSDERLRVDFDACVTLYQDYIRQTTKAKSNTTVNISELKTGKRKADAIEDRYYNKEEYTALSVEQKKELASKRLKQGHKPGAKDSKVKAGSGKAKGKIDGVIRNLKAVNRQVSQLAKQIGKVGAEDDSTASATNSASTADDGTKAKTGSNRTNVSLTRQKKVTITEPKKK
jgi:hypothetical protein